jgi:hypothetical protein
MRDILARGLVVAASVAVVLALGLGYVQRAVLDSDQFANRATDALRDDSVRSLAAERITDDVVLRNAQDLLAARPIIETVAGEIVGSRAFTGLFRSAVRDVHRAVLDRDRDTVTLTVADVGTVLSAALTRLDPATARQVEAAGARVTLVKRDVGHLSADLARIADDVRELAALLLVAAVLLVAAALLASADKRRTIVHLGVGFAVAGVLLVVCWQVARGVAVDRLDQPEERAAGGAVWDAFLGDLRTAAWILAGAGAVVAAAAASVLQPLELGEPLRRAGRALVEEGRRPWLRVVRAVMLLAAGLLLLLEPDAVLDVVLTLAGVYLIYEGANALLRLVYRPSERPAPEPAGRAPARWPRRLVAAGVAGALIVAAVGTFVGSGGTTAAAPAGGPCNGRQALCDRPLDQVALPATHNSMSVPLPGWYSAMQERPIADQLNDGIRGLLIDTHYADKLAGGKLRTELSGRDELRELIGQDGVSDEAIAAAARIRERLGFAGEGERGMYLCHSFCELGGTPLEPALDDIHDFLVAHPGAVLVVVNQDYVTPEDYVGAIRDAGLADLAYTPPASGRWATLGELVDRNRRVVFLAENHAGAAPWYRLAYDGITEETPFGFSRPAQLTEPRQLPASCRPNRGGEGSPLFLMNHWITTDPIPLASNAARVNAYEPLLRRARTCQELRDQGPNLVAVDFYGQGDLFRVVDTLNR